MKIIIMRSRYLESLIQVRLCEGSLHVVEGHEGVVTVDSVDVADRDGREVDLNDDSHQLLLLLLPHLRPVGDVGGRGDGVGEVLPHRLEYALEGQGAQPDEDQPPHDRPGHGLGLGGIADPEH